MIAFEWKNFVNKEAFINQVIETSANLGIDPSWLMLIFKIESGFNRHAQNPYSKGTGLLQWLPSTAKGLGTSIGKIILMSGVEQVQLAERYFAPYKGKMHSVYDVYFAVFSPIGLGKADSFVMHKKGTNGYKWNAIIDQQGNNNGALEVIDIKHFVAKKISAEMRQKDVPKGYVFPN